MWRIRLNFVWAFGAPRLSARTRYRIVCEDVFVIITDPSQRLLTSICNGLATGIRGMISLPTTKGSVQTSGFSALSPSRLSLFTQPLISRAGATWAVPLLSAASGLLLLSCRGIPGQPTSYVAAGWLTMSMTLAGEPLGPMIARGARGR